MGRNFQMALARSDIPRGAAPGPPHNRGAHQRRKFGARAERALAGGRLQTPLVWAHQLLFWVGRGSCMP